MILVHAKSVYTVRNIFTLTHQSPDNKETPMKHHKELVGIKAGIVVSSEGINRKKGIPGNIINFRKNKSMKKAIYGYIGNFWTRVIKGFMGEKWKK